ncbi:MAG: hypothetical protein JO309_00960 [Pseudonocardiales bacterium]|nr:hypothetical protein [Pseudonocardiales bacterium]MBV9727987.1 hypothetical protein [Pseudonocardiales bacterium]
MLRTGGQRQRSRSRRSWLRENVTLVLVTGRGPPQRTALSSNLAATLRALGRDDEASELEEWVQSRR